MIYIKLSDSKYPIYRDDICAAHPNISFPVVIPGETLEALGYAEVLVDPVPDAAWDERAVAQAPILSDGLWRASWEVTKLPLVVTAEILESAKTSAKSRVDSMAGEVRQLIGSQGYGQEMTYLVKVAEAEKFMADPAPQESTYPMIYAEVGITAETPAGVATTVLEMHAMWRQIGAAIEAVRLGAKAEIANAETPDEVQSILNGIQWPNLGQ